MKRSTFVLLGLAVVLLAFAYYKIRPTERSEETYQLPEINLALDISKIVRIEIERSNQHIHMERISNIWKVIEPINFVMDDEAIYRLLEGMAKFKLINLVSSNPQKHGTFSVDQKGTAVTVTYNDGKSISLIIGKSGPTPNQTYVRQNSMDNVYLARGLTSQSVNRALRDWRQRTIFHIDPSLIKLFRIQSDTQKFLIQKKGKIWFANKKVVPRKNVAPALSAISYIRVDDFIDTPLVVTTKPEVHVELIAPELLIMDIYEKGEQHKGHFLKTSLSTTIFVVSDTMVDNLKRLANHLMVSETTPAEDTAAVTFIMPSLQPSASDTELTTSARQVLSSLAVLQSLQLTSSPATEENEGELVVHTVVKGQRLPEIARKYKVTVEQIKKWNLLKSDNVAPNVELYIFIKKK